MFVVPYKNHVKRFAPRDKGGDPHQSTAQYRVHAVQSLNSMGAIYGYSHEENTMLRKSLLYPIAALAMLTTFTLFTHVPFAQAGIPDLTMLSTTILTTAPADQTAPSVKTSWGNLKRLYYDRGQTTTEPNPTVIQKPGVGTAWATYSGDWCPYVLSEEFYTLDKYRTGTSSCVYQGMAMSDWPYVRSDSDALPIVTALIGLSNRGTIDGTWSGKGCAYLGGYCKFFVDLVLYRSSYGIGNGWHLCLPSGTEPSDFSRYMTPYNVRQAQAGWVLQRGGTPPHTALVAANLGWGLDLIDSNNVAYNGSFVIARHAFTWDQLSAFTAFRPTFMKQVVNGALQ